VLRGRSAGVSHGLAFLGVHGGGLGAKLLP
jgi:hypothetical protein